MVNRATTIGLRHEQREWVRFVRTCALVDANPNEVNGQYEVDGSEGNLERLCFRMSSPHEISDGTEA
jgi:hypothetical protein